MKNIEEMSLEELNEAAEQIKEAKKNTKFKKLGCLMYRKIGNKTFIKFRKKITQADDIAIEQIVVLDRFLSDSGLNVNLFGIWNDEIECNFKFYFSLRNGDIDPYILKLRNSDLLISDNYENLELKIGSLSDPNVFKNVSKIIDDIMSFKLKLDDICKNQQKYYPKLLEL